jgi:hypothetical protein
MSKKEPIKSLRAKGSPAKSKAATREPELPDLAQHRWNVGAVAWSPEGHIVILDPELRAKLVRLGRGKKKEIVIGLPPKSGAGVGPLAMLDGYQPYPDGEPLKAKPPRPLELCVCDGRLLRFVKAFQGHLKSKPAGKLGAPRTGR